VRGLLCRMIERGREETELHQMKWGENNSGINQPRAKGGCSFSPSFWGTERKGVNEELRSGNERTTGHYQTMSESNSNAACTADQVSFFLLIIFILWPVWYTDVCDTNDL
jgi:hypothetical protein